MHVGPLKIKFESHGTRFYIKYYQMISEGPKQRKDRIWVTGSRRFDAGRMDLSYFLSKLFDIEQEADLKLKGIIKELEEEINNGKTSKKS